MDRTLDNMYFVQECSLKGTNTPSKVVGYLTNKVDKGVLMESRVMPDRLAFRIRPSAKDHIEMINLRDGNHF